MMEESGQQLVQEINDRKEKDGGVLAWHVAAWDRSCYLSLFDYFPPILSFLILYSFLSRSIISPNPLFPFLRFVPLIALSRFPPSNLPPAPVLHHPSHLGVHLLSSPWLQHSQCFMLSWWLGSRLKPYITAWRWHSPLIIVKGCCKKENDFFQSINGKGEDYTYSSEMH